MLTSIAVNSVPNCWHSPRVSKEFEKALDRGVVFPLFVPVGALPAMVIYLYGFWCYTPRPYFTRTKSKRYDKTYNSKPYSLPPALNSEDRHAAKNCFQDWHFSIVKFPHPVMVTNKRLPEPAAFKAEKKSIRHSLSFLVSFQNAVVYQLYESGKENFSVFCCMLSFTLSGRGKRVDWESRPWNALKAPRALQGQRVTKPL